MSTILKRAGLLGITGVALFGYYANTTIYVGPYFEKNSFNAKNLSFTDKLKYNLFGSADDISVSKSAKLVNPHKNPVGYDFYETRLDAETTSKILSKFKTNEEMLFELQKGFLTGPTLYVHRFLLSRYFKSQGENNRIAGFTKIEPELKNVDLESLPKTKRFDFPLLPKSTKLNYCWDYEDVVGHGLLPKNSIVYGLFQVLDYGARSNGGYYDVAFGGDLLGVSAVHRVEYEVAKDDKGQDNLVIRMVNYSAFTGPNSPAFTDETGGLHEFMTRTIVHDIARTMKWD